MSLLPQAGDIFSGCEIISRCGRGSFGITYLARNPLGGEVIIKIVSSMNHTEREMRGLRNYMSVAGNHGNLLKIHHIGEFEDGFYYIMEAADNIASDGTYLPATLGNYLRCGRKFSPQETVRIICELLSAVQVIHDAGLIHRDIKPDNIIFVDSHPKLSDPGLMVQVGQSASFCGTLGFIPPEAVEQETPPNQNFDLYALGKVFYCMLTNYPPRKYPELPLDLPIEVCRQFNPVISRCCSQNPDRRFKTTAEFLSALPLTPARSSRWDALLEYFRIWRMLDGPRCKKICMYGAIVILALPAFITLWNGIVFIADQVQSIKHTVELAQASIQSSKWQLIKRKIDLFFGIRYFSALCVQLEQYDVSGKDKFIQLYNIAADLKKGNDLQAASDAIDAAKHVLDLLAEKIMPEIPDSVEKLDFQQGNIISAQAHGFLASPLADYMNKAAKADCKIKLAIFDNWLYQNYKGPRCGKNFTEGVDGLSAMIFVPPGIGKSSRNKNIKIPYHYWICRNEVLHGDFCKVLNRPLAGDSKDNLPEVQVLLSDMMAYCRQLTWQMQQKNMLPPGYIVRLPTENEWEYAAGDTWNIHEGRSVSYFSYNHVKKLSPPGSSGSNRMYIQDMGGNVSEVIHPSTEYIHTIISRGGSFRRRRGDANARYEFSRYKRTQNDTGFRVVIAPGDMNYFYH